MNLVDDLDGSITDDVSTVQFGLDGVTYEIDLTEENAGRLRELLAGYVSGARRTGGRVRRGLTPNAKSGNNAGQIRDWARANGIELAARGRIPADVATRYREAQAEDVQPTRKRGAAAARKSTPRKRATRRP